MEPRSDVAILVRIREAERRADRIVRDAEAEAARLLRIAGEQAEELLARRRELLSLRRREALQQANSETESDAQACLAGAESRAQQWTRTRKDRVDRIVDRLLSLLLPS